MQLLPFPALHGVTVHHDFSTSERAKICLLRTHDFSAKTQVKWEPDPGRINSDKQIDIEHTACSTTIRSSFVFLHAHLLALPHKERTLKSMQKQQNLFTDSTKSWSTDVDEISAVPN